MLQHNIELVPLAVVNGCQKLTQGSVCQMDRLHHLKCSQRFDDDTDLQDVLDVCSMEHVMQYYLKVEKTVVLGSVLVEMRSLNRLRSEFYVLLW